MAGRRAPIAVLRSRTSPHRLRQSCKLEANSQLYNYTNTQINKYKNYTNTQFHTCIPT
jgi:hypothetical protein